MKVLILEDEALSAKRASQLLNEFDPSIEVVETLESVEDAAAWLRHNPEPDLMLLDIHLSDGLCFNLFDRYAVKSPVIFTTAYDQYTLQAFKINSIDYLLKPIDKHELNNALAKYHTLMQDRKSISSFDIQRIKQTIQSLSKKYKNRFLVKFGDTIQFKNINEVAYFFADDKVVYLVTNEGRKYLIDYNLESLEEILDPQLFFRINRKLIVGIDAVQKVKTLLNSRLQVFLKPTFEQDTYVSKERSPEFKVWLDN